MDEAPTIADVVTTAIDRLARLTGTDYSLGIDLSQHGNPPSIRVQVGHWLPDDDARLRVIGEVTDAVGSFAPWAAHVSVYAPTTSPDSGHVSWSAVIDGIAWTVWAALREPGRAQVERDLLTPDLARAAGAA